MFRYRSKCEFTVKKALIIEDDQYMIANLVELLSYEGFEVHSIHNGAEAPQVAGDFLPDIILSDMRVPGLDGMGILEAIRSDTKTAHIPFIFLTGRSSSAQVHDALNQGANGYLIKPFQIHELLDLINQLLP